MDIVEYLFKREIGKIKLPLFKIMLDKDITLWEYFGDKMPPKTAVHQVIKLFHIDIGGITINKVLNAFAEGNPEAYNLLLKHPNGTKWLKNTIENLKKMYV